jgi:hypothetical protein
MHITKVIVKRLPATLLGDGKIPRLIINQQQFRSVVPRALLNKLIEPSIGLFQMLGRGIIDSIEQL